MLSMSSHAASKTETRIVHGCSVPDITLLLTLTRLESKSIMDFDRVT
jgi:hypothetical protein